MSWDAWLLFALTEAVLCLSPGPAVLLVLPQGLARGTRASIGALAGRLTALTTRPHAATLANRVAGSMLIVAGVGTAAIRRN